MNETPTSEDQVWLARARRQQELIVKLATCEAISEGHLDAAAREITEAAAKAIDVERVSIWLISDDHRELRCVDLYQRSPNSHSLEGTLYVEDTPNYFKAIADGRAVDAHDARTDPRTCEFRDNYLVPLDIYAMLDAAIRVSGKTVGVVCVEHVGGARRWTADEAAFAGEVSDQFAQAMLNHQRHEYLTALQQAHDELEGRVEHRTNELRAMIRGLRDLYFRMDSSGAILDYHAPESEMLYERPETFIGKRMQDILPEPAASSIKRAVAIVTDTGVPETVEYSLEVSGEDRDFEARIFPVVDGQVAAIVRDITERNRTAESLRRSERLASIGTLAAGIAHEINNPLGTILLAAETAQTLGDAPEDKELLAHSLEQIRHDVRRAGRIVKSVLQFSRQEESIQRKPRGLHEVVERARRDMEEDARRRSVGVELRIPEDLPAAYMNESEMEQVFVNLLANAIEASSAGSIVTVLGRADDLAIEIGIHDDGPGIPPEEQARIFDPFFTTRQSEGGTGLGLSLSLGIVERHGGAIQVETSPEQGTTITVVLPLGESLPAESLRTTDEGEVSPPTE